MINAKDKVNLPGKTAVFTMDNGAMESNTEEVNLSQKTMLNVLENGRMERRLDGSHERMSCYLNNEDVSLYMI